jgi:tight adherence protein B
MSDELARQVQRLAVLSAAGIPPVSAWRHVADAEGADSVAAGVARGLESGQEIPLRLVAAARASGDDESGWGALSAIWTVAIESGASLAPTLARAADVLRDLAQSAREVEVALSGPRATSRVVLALPALGVGLGMLLGFDVIGAFATVPGAICLGAGGILIAIAVRWNRRLVLWARERDATAGLGFDLVAIALAGGGSVERAWQRVVAACEEADVAGPGAAEEAAVAFSRAAGVPVAELLRAEADEARREARAAAASRAAALETRLLLPLGLCVLPAFVLLGVAPIAIAIVSSTTLAV